MDDNNTGGILGNLMQLWANARAPVAPLPGGDQSAFDAFDPTDILKGVGSGLAQFGADTAGGAGDLLQWPRGMASQAGLPTSTSPLLTSGAIRRPLAGLADYQPQTALGQAAQYLGGHVAGPIGTCLAAAGQCTGMIIISRPAFSDCFQCCSTQVGAWIVQVRA